MYTKLSIPERLKDLRVVDKHLTLEQLAEQTGLSRSALGKYESDDYKDISPFAIATLAEFYGVSTDYLMGLSEKSPPPVKRVARDAGSKPALLGRASRRWLSLSCYGKFAAHPSHSSVQATLLLTRRCP